MLARSAANLLKTLGFILMVGIVAVTQAPAQTKDVNVVNTPNVSVTNTPSVTVTNTPTVNVGNTASVNVTNTSAQPVPSVSIDQPGRIAYQSQVSKSDGSCTGASVCNFDFPNVPAGHRVVIQHISGIVDFVGTPSATWVQLNNGSGMPVSTFFAPMVPLISFSAFDQTVQTYFDPAVSAGIIEVQVNLVGGATFPGGGPAEIITLSGYELDCTVAPCAPIAR